MKKATNRIFHQLNNFRTYITPSRMMAWLLLVQIIVQTLAPYPYGLLIRNVEAQDVPTPTTSQDVMQSPLAPTPTSPSSPPTPTTTEEVLPSSTPTPTTKPEKAESKKPTLTPTLTPTPTQKRLDNENKRLPTATPTPTVAIDKKSASSNSSRKLTELKTNPKARIIPLNKAETKQTYVHKDKKTDPSEEVSLRSLFGKAYKVSESDALADPDFEKDTYKKIKKEKGRSTSEDTYVAPTSKRIVDGLLGSKPEPTPLPKEPLPAQGKVPKTQKNDKTQASKSSKKNVKSTPTPTPFSPPKITKDPNVISVDSVIPAKKSNENMQNATEGIYRFEVSTGEQIHYQNEEGVYKEIDTTAVLDETERYGFRNAAGPYTFRAAQTLGGGVEYVGEDGKVCRFGLGAVEGASINTEVIGSIQGNKIVYKNIYTDADLEFTMTNSGVKTEVVAKTKSARKASYTFDLYECTASFREPTVTLGSIGSTTTASQSLKSDSIIEALVDEKGELIEEKTKEIKQLTVRPNYSTIEKVEQDAVDARTGLLDKVGSLIPVIGNSAKKKLTDVGLTEELRIDPTLSDWIYESYIDSSGLANRADYTHAIGTIGGYVDSRAFYFFNRDSIPNAGFDPIGGYLTLRQLESNGDVYAEVYATKFGTSTSSENSIIGMYNAMTYPGVGSSLPGLVTVGSDGNITSTYADRTGVPQYIGSSINGDRRIHVPAWLFQRWKNAPCAAEGCWTTNEGLMVKAANNKGMRFKSGYDPNTANHPQINVYMSSDTPHPDQGRPPTIPDIYMPLSGAYIQSIGGKCDESVSPSTGDCRANTYVPLVTGAGDPDGWGPGDILGVQYSVWSDGQNTAPFIYGTSPGITANLTIEDNIYYWTAYSKDRTNRVSATTPQRVFITDTTPPSVPELNDLAAFTPGTGTEASRQVDIVSPGSHDAMHVKAAKIFGTYYTIDYQLEYSTSSNFSTATTTTWQTNNPLFAISAYGADQQSGTADDLLENTRYYFRMKARDTFGNVSAWSSAVSTTFDTAQPTISDESLSAQRSSESMPAEWSFSYQDANISKATFSLVNSAETQTASSAAITKQPTKTIVPVPGAGQAYKAAIVSVDKKTKVYVAMKAINKVAVIDGETGTTTKTISTTSPMSGIIYGAGYIWAIDESNSYLYKIDPASDTVVKKTHLSLPVTNNWRLTYAYGALWVSAFSSTNQQIFKINADTAALQCTVRPPGTANQAYVSPEMLVTTEGKLWATYYSYGFALEINSDCNIAKQSDYLGFALWGLFEENNNIWVAAYGDSKMVKMDKNGHKLASYSIPGSEPLDGIYDGQHIYVLQYGNSKYVKYDPATMTPIEENAISPLVTLEVYSDGRYHWLPSNSNPGTIYRYDTAHINESQKPPEITTQTIATPTIVDARALGSLPQSAAYRLADVTIAGEKYMYAVQQWQGAVSKVRSRDAHYETTIQLDKTKFANLGGIAAAGTTIYVTSQEGWLGVIDATTDSLTATYHIANSSDMLTGVAAYRGNVWVGYYGKTKITKLDPTTFTSICEADISTYGSTLPISTNLKVLGQNLWANHYSGGRLLRIGNDCAVAAVTQTQPHEMNTMFTEGAYIWGITYSGAKAYAYDMQTGAYVKSYATAAGPTTGAYDGKNYWIATAGNPEKIIKYNSTFTELSRYQVTNGNVSSQDVVKDGKYLWFSNFDTGSLTRFDTTPTEPYGSVIPEDEVIYTNDYLLAGLSGSQNISFNTLLSDDSQIDDGTYTAKLIVTDKAGQSKELKKTMVVDNSAPSIALTNSLASGWVTDTSVLLQGQLAATHIAGKEDYDVLTFEYRFGGSGGWTAIPFDSQNIFNTTITAPAGASTLNLRAKDSVQNSTQVSYAIQTDATDPELSAITPVTLYAGPRPTLSYHVEEAVSGSGIPYGTNPQGMKVQLQYTQDATAIVKTLVDNGVVGDASLATTLTCAPSVGATTSTDNGVTVASAVDCSMPVLSDLPEALYNLVVWANDYAGHEVADYSTFQVKHSIYHIVESPEADAHIASGSALLRATTSRGAQLTIENQQLDESRTFTLNPSLAGTGNDDFILDNFVVTCGEMRDTDNNPATPDEEVCDWYTRVASSVADTDTDTANTLHVTAADGYGNDSTKTIEYIANVYGINLTLQPANRYFSPNGDGQLDGVVFNTTIDSGATVADWTITIKDSNETTIRTLAGTNSLPSTIPWDGENSSATAVVDGEYTWSAVVHANDIIFIFPSVQNESTATLTAKSSIADQTLIMSPSTGYVTSAGVVAVAGLAPATVDATDLTENKLKGSILVRICVDTVGTSADCDYVSNANVDENGNFSTLVVLPKDEADDTVSHTISAYAYDEYGNSTDVSNSVTVTTDTRGSILSASSTALTPASTSEAYAAYEAGTADIDTVANAWVRVSVSQYTQYIKLSYASHTIRDGLYQATGELTTIGYINNQVESSSSKNPDGDNRVKHIQATNPILTDYSQAIANTCQTVAGCEWYVRLPVTPSQAGVYDIVVQAVKGEAVSEASVGYKVDGSSPSTPTVAMTDQVVDGSVAVAYVHNEVVQVRSARVRLYGATTPGSKLKVLVGVGNQQPADMYVNGSSVSEVSIGAQGIYEVDVDVSDFLASGTPWDTLACTARDSDTTCELGTFTLTPQSHEVDGDGNAYHEVIGESVTFGYDAQPPAAEEIAATTTGVEVISPWGQSGTPIHYAVTTTDPVRYAQIKRPDTFTRIFDAGASNSFSASFPMAKNDATASATMLDREGYFNPIVTLVDYAGNTTTYDAADYAEYELGDFRGRIDDSIPLTSRMPFATWGEGGKTAHDEPLTEDSVYINTLSQGFVTRKKTIRIKALAEKGQRVQFKVNGENHGSLVDVTAANCVVPEADTPSSESPDTTRDPEMTEDLVWSSTTGEYMLPTADRTSANGLTVRDSEQCEVSTTYTFPGDGSSHQEDGTPTESMYVQMVTVDHAGSTSNISFPTSIYYDTFDPLQPGIMQLGHDDIYAVGEANSDMYMEMKSPSGVITTTKLLKANYLGMTSNLEEGGVMDTMHLVFTDEYGDYIVKLTSYDAAGNTKVTTKTYTRRPNVSALSTEEKIALGNKVADRAFLILGEQRGNFPNVSNAIVNTVAINLPDGVADTTETVDQLAIDAVANIFLVGYLKNPEDTLSMVREINNLAKENHAQSIGQALSSMVVKEVLAENIYGFENKKHQLLLGLETDDRSIRLYAAYFSGAVVTVGCVVATGGVGAPACVAAGATTYAAQAVSGVTFTGDEMSTNERIAMAISAVCEGVCGKMAGYVTDSILGSTTAKTISTKLSPIIGELSEAASNLASSALNRAISSDSAIIRVINSAKSAAQSVWEWIAGRVVAKQVPQATLDWLAQGSADTVVYIGRNEAGDAVYVGITNDLPRRITEHGNRFAVVESISNGVKFTPHKARAVEQVIIEANPTYQNVYNSINYKRDIYDGALDWAKSYMNQSGISAHY